MLPVEKKADWRRKKKNREMRTSLRVRGRYWCSGLEARASVVVVDELGFVVSRSGFENL